MVADASPWGVHVTVTQPCEADLLGGLTWAQNNSQKSGLGPRLEGHWRRIHESVEATETTPPPAAHATAQCRLARVCLCDERGLGLKARGARFLKYMRQVCPVGSRTKADLLKGKVVVKLSGRPASYEAMPSDNAHMPETWLHIGYHSLQPYAPWFLEVTPCADPGEVAPAAERVYVDLVDFVRFYPAFETFAECEIIEAQWYRLEESKRAMSAFAPSPLPIVQLAAWKDAERFWPRRVRQASESGAGGGDLSEGEEEGEAEPPAEGEEALAAGIDDAHDERDDMTVSSLGGGPRSLCRGIRRGGGRRGGGCRSGRDA